MFKLLHKLLHASIPKKIGENNVVLIGTLLLSLFKSSAYERTTKTPFPIMVDNFSPFGEVVSPMVADLSDYVVPLIL